MARLNFSSLIWGIIKTYLSCLVCSANSTLIKFDISGNLNMSAAARKAIEIEFVLCQLRNPEVSQINASDKDIDDQDAIKIVEVARYVLQ